MGWGIDDRAAAPSWPSRFYRENKLFILFLFIYLCKVGKNVVFFKKSLLTPKPLILN